MLPGLKTGHIGPSDPPSPTPKAADTMAETPDDTTNASPTADDIGPDADDTDLLRRIGSDPVTLDTLQSELGWPVDRLMGQLTLLEIAGRIERTPDGRYKRQT